MHSMRKLLVLILLLLLTLPVLAQDGESINFGDRVEGELTESATESLYTFEGEQGQLVTITLLSDQFDAFLRLRDAEGSEVASNDDGAGSLNSRIGPFPLPANGDYTIVATSLSGSATGLFTLSLETVTLDMIEYTQTIEHELTDDLLTVTYRFTGQAGDAVIISMDSSDFDSYLELSNSANPGVFIAADDDSGTGYNSLLGPFILPETSVYMITARSLSSTATGSYVLKLDKVEVTALEFGSSVEAELTGGPLYFSFEATSGQEVNISVDSNDRIDTTLTLRGPNGYTLATDDDSGGRLDPEIQRYFIMQDGAYMVLISPFSSVDTGVLTISLEESVPMSLDDGPQVIRLGEKRNQERVVFEAEAGEKVRLTFVIEGNRISPYLELTQGGSSLGNYSFPNVEEVSFVTTIAAEGQVGVLISDYSYTTVVITVTLERIEQ